MARKGSVGEIRVVAVPTIASATLVPSAAEIGAGTDLTPYLTRTGVSTPNSASTIDISPLSDRRNQRAAGTYGGDDWTLSLFRDSVVGSDGAWTLLTQDLETHIVIRRFGGSAAAIVAADKVEVAKVSVTSRVMDTPAENAPQTFSVVLAVARANDSATVSV